MIREASIGFRNIGAGRSVAGIPTPPPAEGLGSGAMPSFFDNDGKKVRIARPQLVVIAGFLLASELESILRIEDFQVQEVRVDWGRKNSQKTG